MPADIVELEWQRRHALRAIACALSELKWLGAARRFEIAMERHALALKYGYNPSQPRVPRGEDGAGEWTRVGGGYVRVAGGGRSSDGGRSRYGDYFPGATHGQLVRLNQNIARTEEALKQIGRYDPNWRPGAQSLSSPGSIEGAIRHSEARAIEAAAKLQQLRSGIGGNLGPRYEEPANRTPSSGAFDGPAWIVAYRSANNMPDLFGRPSWPNDRGTVAVAEVDGRLYFGVNSRGPGYSSVDRREADIWRTKLNNKYTSHFDSENIGEVPNDSFYHAEATILVRASRENGGTLEGRTIEVHTDRKMCPTSCPIILPRLGLELGNPRVVFTDQNGTSRTMYNGKWE
jgi:hypothetical protein